MSRRPALVTEADLNRLSKVAKAQGVTVRLIRPDGTAVEVTPEVKPVEPRKKIMLV